MINNFYFRWCYCEFLGDRAEIHQALLSDFSHLTEIFIAIGVLRERRVPILVNFTPGHLKWLQIEMSQSEDSSHLKSAGTKGQNTSGWQTFFTALV